MKQTLVVTIALAVVAGSFPAWSSSAASFVPGTASATPRNGTGFNKQFLGNTGPPVIGNASWGLRITPTCTITGTWAVRIHARPSAPIMTAAGEILVDGSSRTYFQATGAVALVGGTLTVHLPIPNDASLCGVTGSAQAISYCVGTGAPPDLSNAVDFVVGT